MLSCNHCHLLFSPKVGSTGKFCSQSCSASFNNRARGKKPKKLAKNPRPIGPFTRVANCTVCSKYFEQIGNKRVCSDSCYIHSKHKCARGSKGITYKGKTFDSKWEIQLARHMDEQNIEWTQIDQSLLWVDSNGKVVNIFQIFIYQNMIYIWTRRINLSNHPNMRNFPILGLITQMFSGGLSSI